MKHSTKSDLFKKSTLLAMLLTFCAGSLFMISCEKKGPMEKAGEDMDDAIEETGDAVEDATN